MNLGGQVCKTVFLEQPNTLRKSPDCTAPVASFMKSSLNLCLCHTMHSCRCKLCYPEGCAAPSFVPCQCNTQGSLSKLKGAPPQRKINVTCKSPVGDISVVTLIRTDTTLDHSQKAEKVCSCRAQLLLLAPVAASKAFFRLATRIGATPSFFF